MFFAGLSLFSFLAHQPNFAVIPGVIVLVRIPHGKRSLAVQSLSYLSLIAFAPHLSERATLFSSRGVRSSRCTRSSPSERQVTTEDDGVAGSDDSSGGGGGGGGGGGADAECKNNV